MPATALVPIRRALLSVSDKTGLLELAHALAACRVELISTGGTAKVLREAGLEVREVSALTGFPEMMDGRVKTLHPKVHGGLLGRRAEDAEVMAEQGILPIDLLVLNLYPFEATVARDACTLEEAIENIDIGGPAMLRAAAKNWNDVAVLTDPAQYPALADELKNQAGVSRANRFRLMVAAFNAVARYDAAISDYLSALELNETQDAIAARSRFSAEYGPRFEKLADLRYGENPHQAAAFYRDPEPLPGTLATYQQLQGKALSYNNIADADAAWECVRQFEQPACVIVKHANPCGVAVASDPATAYAAAYATDPSSAFGGIIAFNQPLDEATLQTILQRQFVEVLIAPGFAPQALQAAKAKANVRLLQIALGRGHHRFDLKRVGSGLLVQTADDREIRREELKVVSRRQPSAAELEALLFAWQVAKYVKSNAIVYAKEQRTIGIGAGQMSRVTSAKIAALKAAEAGLAVAGSVMASDAFFPFRDGIDEAAAEGIRAVIQPGGSMRDDEVIAAADEHDMSMVFTGIRHFRH